VIERLLEIMARLRDPDSGCPWDREQTHATIAPYTIEEAYEVDEAIRAGDFEGLKDELGDLLLQVVYHAQMASEGGRFAFSDVVEAICDKLVRRHPHVFAEADLSGPALGEAWEDAKARERAEKARGLGRKPDLFDDVPRALPALARAAKLLKRAFRADRVAIDGGRARRRAIAALEPAAITHEGLGRLLLCLVEIARAEGLDAETALRDANERFERSHRER